MLSACRPFRITSAIASLVAAAVLCFSPLALAKGGYVGHLPKPHCPAETALGRFIDKISNRCYYSRVTHNQPQKSTPDQSDQSTEGSTPNRAPGHN